jgi:hypothetical protein
VFTGTQWRLTGMERCRRKVLNDLFPPRFIEYIVQSQIGLSKIHMQVKI